VRRFEGHEAPAIAAITTASFPAKAGNPVRGDFSVSLHCLGVLDHPPSNSRARWAGQVVFDPQGYGEVEHRAVGQLLLEVAVRRIGRLRCIGATSR